MAALLLLLALTAGRARNPLEWGPLHHLGEISYATYLSHFLPFVVFKLLMVSDASAVPPVLIAPYLLLAFAASIAPYPLVERPAQKWVNPIRPPGTLRSPAPWATPSTEERRVGQECVRTS